MMSATKPLSPDQLYTACDQSDFDFQTTSDLEGLEEVLGQPRALAALHYGTHVGGDGFNVFALGPPGIKKHEIVKRILEKEATARPTPSDWCYVYNFSHPHRPNALELPAGRASSLHDDMEQLIEDLSSAIPSAFQTEEYQSRIDELERDFVGRRDKALQELANESNQKDIRLLHTQSGFAFAPVDKSGEVINPEEFGKLSDEQKKRIESAVEDLQRKLQKIIRHIPVWQKETREKVKEIDREIARNAVGHLIEVIQEHHTDLPEVLEYLAEVERDIIDHVREFRGESESPLLMAAGRNRADALRRYKVNVIVDHDSEGPGAAVIYQDSPSYANLIGRIEYQSQMGTLVTEFTLIKAGDLHRANGGYLVVDAERILRQPFAWEGLKRALRAKRIRIEPLEKAYGLVSTVSLEPEPIPLDIKVVLVGDRRLYYLLDRHDPDFADLFKVAADFSEDMQRERESTWKFARLIARLVNEEGLRALDAGAVARVIEHSSRLAGDASKLSVNLRQLSELLRESDYRARFSGADVVNRQHVQESIDAKICRHDRLREDSYEAIERKLIKIDTSGSKIGQINGLAVLNLGDFSYGQPTRITVTTRMGEGKFLDIQRESELGGNIHSKGVLILTHYLSSRYAKDYPLSLSASIAFEQSYGVVDGDSASLAELCALLSALSETPLSQAVAVTGSVNQRGEVQAIGGANQKIEGFFDVCSRSGAEKGQAVIIPRANVPHLMLRQDLVEAVRAGSFRVYAVENVDQAMEILTGVEAGAYGEQGKFDDDSVNGRVEQSLIQLALRRREFGRNSESEPEK